MSSTLDPLAIRRVLGRKTWGVPEPFGPAGWRLIAHTGDASVIVSEASFEGALWWHASMSGPGRVPTYDELMLLHRAVWGTTGWSYQIQAPTTEHINIHDHTLHLWGRADGEPILPNFGQHGTI